MFARSSRHMHMTCWCRRYPGANSLLLKDVRSYWGTLEVANSQGNSTFWKKIGSLVVVRNMVFIPISVFPTHSPTQHLDVQSFQSPSEDISPTSRKWSRRSFQSFRNIPERLPVSSIILGIMGIIGVSHFTQMSSCFWGLKHHQALLAIAFSFQYFWHSKIIPVHLKTWGSLGNSSCLPVGQNLIKTLVFCFLNIHFKKFKPFKKTKPHNKRL